MAALDRHLKEQTARALQAAVRGTVALTRGLGGVSGKRSVMI